MDYKKIIAATAVTSAAFVVPVVVGAEAIEEEILFDLAQGVNVQVGQELVVSKIDANSEEVEFEWYKWTVANAEGTVVQQLATTAKFKPTYNLLDKDLKVEAKVKGSDEIYTQTVKVAGFDEKSVVGLLPDSTSLFWNDQVTVNPVNATGVKFNPSKIEWYADGVLVGNAATLKVPYGANALKAIVVDPSGTEVYVDSITLEGPSQVPLFAATGANEVNDTLTIDLQEEGIIKNIDWYINGEFYKSGMELSLDIPVIAANKEVSAIVTFETIEDEYNPLEIKRFQDSIMINELSLPENSEPISKINRVEISELANEFIVGNDVLSVELPEYTGPLTIDQMNISYEWYGTNEKSRIKILNATTNSYTVPANTASLPYRNYIAKMIVTVPGTDLNEIYYSKTFTYYDELEELLVDLIADIDALQDSSTKYITELAVTLQTIIDEYSSLSPNAQKLVTNASKLTTAQNDLKVASPVIKTLNDFKAKYDEMSMEQLELKHKELLKEVTKIQAQLEKLTPLQQSVISADDVSSFTKIHEYLVKYSGKITEENSTTQIVTQLNNQIEELITDFGTLEAKYAVERIELQQNIEELNKRIKTIDKKYVPLIKTTILKNAEADLKKSERTAKKIQAIETTEASKKEKAANAARIEFNKLSLLQQSLITPEEHGRFELEESDPETKVSELTDKIDSIVTGVGYNFSSDVFAGGTLTQVYEQLVAEYKALSSTDRKLVTNYAIVSQFGKDIKAATSAKKPLIALQTAMNAYDEAEEDKKASKRNAAYSKYKAAYKAYTKLTPLQQSILTSPNFLEELDSSFDYQTYFVYGSAAEFEELLAVPEPKEDANPEKIPSLDNAVSVVNLLESFYAGILDGNYSVDEAKQEIELIKAAYKALLSAEKKNVYNYSLISTVNSMISKATSAKKKLDSANTEAKLVSAIAAYNKLSDPQQKLIVDSYLTAESKLNEILELKPDGSIIDEEIAELVGDYTKDAIQAITDQLKLLPSKEQKALKNYKIYTDALKDLKAVEKFVSNVQKQGTTLTYSKIEKILKDFNKLTKNQVKLLDGYDEILLESIKTWSANMGNRANELNEKLASMLSLDEYNLSVLELENSDVQLLQLAILDLEAAYKPLDSKEKKLVTNYGVIKTLKSDLKKVEPVLALLENFDSLLEQQQIEAVKKAQVIYQRLTLKQVSLYKQLSDVDLDEVQ